MWRSFRERLVFRQTPIAVSAECKHHFIQAHRGRWTVIGMCRVLGVSEQGYYRFLRRPEKSRNDRELLEQIYECLREDEGTATITVSRRIIAWLRLQRSYTGGARRICHICQEHHLTIRRKRRSNGTTQADRQSGKSENLIKRDFTAEKPNQKFLTDITEIPCADGKLYLAAVLDCFDGSIQGFAMAGHMQPALQSSVPYHAPALWNLAEHERYGPLL